MFSAVRNFDRSSVRSRSFRRLNRAFSVLRRTKSGNAVSNETLEERDNARNSSVPQEGDDHLLSPSFLRAGCVFAMFAQLEEEGGPAGSTRCNSSICFFNNSAADCVNPLVD